MNTEKLGRPVVDKLVRKQLSITAANSSSAEVTYETGRQGWATMLIPIIEAFDSNLGLWSSVAGRYKIGLTMKIKDRDESILNDATEITLINNYFTLPDAKPILLGADERLTLVANHDTGAGKSPGTFAAVTVEVLFMVTYITQEEFIALNRRNA